jgi:hypothetical protein
MTVVEETRSTGTELVVSGLVVPGPARWLGRRFRLDERITAAGGPSVWKATDDLLCRSVTVHLLPRGAPVPPPVVEAVQAAARVNDSRLATIYDTDFSTQSPYIVSEWTRGTHLEDLVLSGLPRPALAAAMIADAADAIDVAHRAGRPHLCLGPRSARWDTGSGLKITGLGIDAALSGMALSGMVLSGMALPGMALPGMALPGAGAADPAAADTMALARMLYALLTGYWAGDEPTALPAAPRHRGRLYTPRQVRAGVPGVLDAITRYALQLQPGGPRALRTPAGLAMALRSVQRPTYMSSRATGPIRPAPARHARPRNGVRHRTELLHPAA